MYLRPRKQSGISCHLPPRLVGVHCIGVDPYYLTYRAEKAGYHPQVILAGRQINDDVGARIARECVRAITLTGRRPETVTILGLTFKENVPDIRNSKVVDIVQELRAFGIAVQVHDPLANADEIRDEYGLTLTPLAECDLADAVILAVAHDDYVKEGWPGVKRLLKQGRGVVLDIKAKLSRKQTPDEIVLWRL